MVKSESKENLIQPDPEAPRSSSAASQYDALTDVSDYVLSATEKKFLLTAERGDCAGVRR